MNTQVLIDSIVRQVAVLIAQLATSGGLRAPLAHLANQVFVELVNELAAQGVSRKVSADMFGMALRAYIRKVRRLSEGRTEPGRTLWQAVLDFVRSENLVARSRVLSRLAHDGEIEVCGDYDGDRCLPLPLVDCSQLILRASRVAASISPASDAVDRGARSAHAPGRTQSLRQPRTKLQSKPVAWRWHTRCDPPSRVSDRAPLERRPHVLRAA